MQLVYAIRTDLILISIKTIIPIMLYNLEVGFRPVHAMLKIFRTVMVISDWSIKIIFALIFILKYQMESPH